ncbi:hypothetical protein H9P43_000869 [Blastocladiella emersonii ATCC 22665]|nr:hypothetical protein H9P43_000869 [Blastocladiella emersonii ATCC 22665]
MPPGTNRLTKPKPRPTPVQSSQTVIDAQLDTPTLLSLHHTVTTPRRAVPERELFTASYFFQCSTPTMVYSHFRFTPETMPSLGNYPEIAVIGPSNAGKSTLLKSLVTRLNGKIATASKKPGSTKSINFYNLSNRLMLVDTMGYGIGSKRDWGGSIEAYLTHRKELRHVYWLLPAHASVHEFDLAIGELLRRLNIRYTVIMTQIDTLPSTAAFLRQLDTMYRTHVEPAPMLCDGIIPISSLRFTPTWDPLYLGTTDLAGRIATAAAHHDPPMPAPTSRMPGLHLGWVSANENQVRYKVPQHSATPALHLNKPGQAELQHHIMNVTGQDMERWHVRAAKAFTPQVKDGAANAEPVPPENLSSKARGKATMDELMNAIKSDAKKRNRFGKPIKKNKRK